jgi:hypothetical protein
MNIRERTIIDRPAVKVWPYIVNPEYFQKWNDKIVSMEARERFQLGQPFATHYKWRQKELQCLSVAVRIEEGHLLELRHSSLVGAAGSSDIEVVEQIVLEEKNGRTVVTKNVMIKHHDIPWVLVPLIWFITRFGKPVEEDRLKIMCESRP